MYTDSGANNWFTMGSLRLAGPSCALSSDARLARKGYGKEAKIVGIADTLFDPFIDQRSIDMNLYFLIKERGEALSETG